MASLIPKVVLPTLLLSVVFLLKEEKRKSSVREGKASFFAQK
jgi:hypothetical protein